MNSLYPGFIRVIYHSGFGSHTMTLPVNTPTIDSGDPTQSTIHTWDDNEIVWTDMMDALLEDLADWFAASVEFDTATLYTMETPTSPALPRDSYSLDFVGTNVTVGWNKATQYTLTFRTASFGTSKLVLLDMNTGSNFGRVTDPAGNASLLALIEEWTSEANGWAGRDGARPATFIQASVTLNEKLRREYDLQ